MNKTNIKFFINYSLFIINYSLICWGVRVVECASLENW